MRRQHADAVIASQGSTMHRNLRLQSAFGLTSALAAAAAVLVAACGGGNSGGTGVLRLSLTDAPACGYDNAWVTVQKVRVHQSDSAGDNDSGWHEVVLATPQRVDLLTLNNGVLMPLGQTELPAGTYTQMRLVLAANSASDPLANAIKPSGGSQIALTTPSGQQSGLKMNVNLKVEPDTVADFAIDFDACKSFVRAGNSGRYLLKPVLSVIPIISSKIVGFVDPAIANGGTTVSAQVAGSPVRSTAPDGNGRFELAWVPVGTYDLVITAQGRVNAVMNGVPVAATGATTIGSDTARLAPPPSSASAAVSGTVTAAGEADVRALQVLSNGTKMEVGYSGVDPATGAYGFALPTGAPVSAGYASGATSFPFVPDNPRAGQYRIEARSGTAVQGTDVTLPAASVDFAFP
jgi:hypothetical protein